MVERELERAVRGNIGRSKCTIVKNVRRDAILQDAAHIFDVFGGQWLRGPQSDRASGQQGPHGSWETQEGGAASLG